MSRRGCSTPVRNVERYPIQRDKIDALRESIRTTTFWDNIGARKNGKGAEIAYGHHRPVALKEEYGPNHKAGLILTRISLMDHKFLAKWFPFLM